MKEQLFTRESLYELVWSQSLLSLQNVSNFGCGLKKDLCADGCSVTENGTLAEASVWKEGGETASVPELYGKRGWYKKELT